MAEAAERQLLVMLPLPKPHFRPGGGYGGSYGEGLSSPARRRLAAELARLHGLELQRDWPMQPIGVDCFVMRLPAGDDRPPQQVAEQLAKDPRIAWAQAMQVFRTQADTRHKPLFAAQPAASQWQLAELHRLATGRGVQVAVIDSGIAAQHPELVGQVIANENLVDERPTPAESHGTAVAGIIAARADTAQGGIGIAPQARLLGLRACVQRSETETLCTSLSLAKALLAALQRGTPVINMSLTGPPDRLLATLIDQATARGQQVVAALDRGAASFPASHPGVLAVADAPPLPSGAVLAPGRDVPSTQTSGWGLVSGSSFSAAHVSGLLALMRELGGSREALSRGALVTDANGRIDACASLLARSSSGTVVHCHRLVKTPE
ncbi:S8 family serine peptidase [Pelomonas sp. SE-A7]|uniref:S8 family peptidase n=1 Tax=Pelomonas sp. SE-A7 TaxID=3054953 RepID=UPI00259CBD43|nr:S8 family serine peptidase [Pelomonas sp. SE-A7]MDM4765386.1 S8 family serine peptidase [Pelomonas sp. SE-A7]